MIRVAVRPDDTGRTVGELVRSIRAAAGFTQAQLADRLDTTQSVVSRWESGRDEARLSTLARIARACGHSLVIGADVDDVDRAQIREHLALTPVQRLTAVRNVSRLVSSAQPRD